MDSNLEQVAGGNFAFSDHYSGEEVVITSILTWESASPVIEPWNPRLQMLDLLDLELIVVLLLIVTIWSMMVKELTKKATKVCEGF